ncbi:MULTISPECIES: penicillin-binding transpeptidase domain-containing protein [Enterococcus]|uniref:penicillin-binding protein PBP4(5) n=1 Tax=Enterococcus TaxID=1350 RepID=UPI003565C66B
MRHSGNRKSRKGMFIVAGLLVLGSLAFFLFRNYNERRLEEKGKDTIEAFVDQLSKGRYQEVGKYLSPASIKAAGFSRQQVSDKYQNIYGGIGVHHIRIENLSVKNNHFSYTLVLTTSLGEPLKQKYSGSFKKGNDLIQWAPNLIFPSMKPGDKVRYQFIPATRGEIVDREGHGLAINGKIFNFGIVPKDLGTGEKRKEKIKGISEALKISEKSIHSKLKQAWVKEDYFVPLKTETKMTEDFELPEGLEVREDTGRTYPIGEAAAHLIGYVGDVSAEDMKKNKELTNGSIIGRTGLERVFDKELRGKNGGYIAITNAEGKEKEILQNVEVVEGKRIELTIDVQAQYLAYKSLENEQGSSVVSDPSTGELLAVASSPSFDPNQFTYGISQEDYDKLSEDEALPFLARYANGYAPGSTFKLVTAAIGLDAGTLDPNQAVAINGLKWQQDASWGGYQVTRVSDVSPVNLRSAMIYSDNIYMAKETLKMGEKTFREGLNKFIFGAKLDLPIEMQPAQISSEKKFNSEILLADTGYGQGQLLLNPIQQITMYSVFPNKGKLVYPKLLKSQKSKNKNNVVSVESATRINEDMQAVVEDPNGTAHSLQSLGVPLMAKTGTAEIKEKQDERGQQNSFLYAFDAQQRKFAVLQFLEDRPDEKSAVGMVPELLTYLSENMK